MTSSQSPTQQDHRFRTESFSANEDIFPEAANSTLSQQPPASYPHSAAPLETTTTTTHQDDLIVLHKNARSLCTEDSIDELLTELQRTPWHVIAINETWRTHKRELWITKHEQHVFAGSGHDKATRGVGFLIHSSPSRAI